MRGRRFVKRQQNCPGKPPKLWHGLAHKKNIAALKEFFKSLARQKTNTKYGLLSSPTIISMAGVSASGKLVSLNSSTRTNACVTLRPGWVRRVHAQK